MSFYLCLTVTYVQFSLSHFIYLKLTYPNSNVFLSLSHCHLCPIVSASLVPSPSHLCPIVRSTSPDKRRWMTRSGSQELPLSLSFSSHRHTLTHSLSHTQTHILTYQSLSYFVFSPSLILPTYTLKL